VPECRFEKVSLSVTVKIARFRLVNPPLVADGLPSASGFVRAEKFSATSETSVILHFMRLKPEVREEVLQILQMLIHKDIPNQLSVKKGSSASPQPKATPVPADFLTIRPD